MRLNIDAMKTSIPFQSQQPVFSKVGNILDLINMTPEELERYNISLDTYRTNRVVMLNERAEGVEEGLERGRAEGLVEGRAEGLVKGRAEGESQKSIEIASRMKSEGLPVVLISRMTGLSLEEIGQL